MPLRSLRARSRCTKRRPGSASARSLSALRRVLSKPFSSAFQPVSIRVRNSLESRQRVHVGRKDDEMTGVKVPIGVAGASAALGPHAVKGTLPFTGAALTVYAAAGGRL